VREQGYIGGWIRKKTGNHSIDCKSSGRRFRNEYHTINGVAIYLKQTVGVSEGQRYIKGRIRKKTRNHNIDCKCI